MMFLKSLTQHTNPPKTKKTLRYNVHGYHWSPKIILFVCLLYLLRSVPATADSTFTVDGIADAMLQAQASFANLQLEYLKIDHTPKPKRMRIVEAKYAQKVVKSESTSQRLRYLDRTVTMVDPNTNQSSLVVDALTTFDGDATATLNRMAEPNKPMQAGIYAGYRYDKYPVLDRDPHTTIWYLGPKGHLGELIKKNRDTFRIKNESEEVNGVSTVKLVGTILNGKATLKLWVSPERNFLPMKQQIIRNYDQLLLSETVLSNLVQLTNSTWYPMTIRSGNPDPEFSTIYDISNISIDPIPEEFFSPKFPPNTHVYDDILKISYTTY